MLAPPVLGPLLLGLALAQGLLTLWLLLLVRRQGPRAQAGPDVALADLAARVEPHLRQLFETLDERQRQAAALVQEADQLVARLRAAAAAGGPAPLPPDDPEPALESRAVARKLLAEGRSLDEVAAQTGLPVGELRILQNLLAARQRDSDLR
jgi:hypothetical protein